MTYKTMNSLLMLNNLHCFSQSDQGGGSSEPFLWTVFFKIDADILANNMQPTVMTTPGNHGDLLNQDVDAGENNPILPPLGMFSTKLKPLPFPGKEGESIIGCVAVVMEEDDTPDHAISKGHQKLNQFVTTTLQSFVDNAVKTGKMPTQSDINKAITKAKSAISGAVANDLSFWEKLANQDDFIGATVFYFSLADLHKYGSQGHKFQHDFLDSKNGGNGTWRLQGIVLGKPA